MDNSMTSNKVIQMLRSGAIVPERYGDYWDDEDRERLKAMFLAGEGITQIAIDLQRSESSVFQQLVYLDMFADSRATRMRRKAPIGCKCSICSSSDEARPSYCPLRNISE